LRKLADYCNIHGHCNVPLSYSENTNLGQWVGNQRTQYRLHLEGKASRLTTFRIQELDSLGFEWKRLGAAWEDSLSQLVDYRKVHGHCDVPQSYTSKNAKLTNWVGTQRKQYKLHQQGEKSHMTPFRIQELERLGFEWTLCPTTWEDRLSELTDYFKIHGHCNVPLRYSENTKLGSGS
jgi:hypothetical protein